MVPGLREEGPLHQRSMERGAFRKKGKKALGYILYIKTPVSKNAFLKRGAFQYYHKVECIGNTIKKNLDQIDSAGRFI